ncbi:hypothetical protein STEG23_031835 [Scotinomys teguina]
MPLEYLAVGRIPHLDLDSNCSVTIRVSTSVSSTPIQFCRNGGTWQNGRCICTEEWKGLRCTIANFCENSTYGNLTFSRIPVGRYGPSLQTCPAGTLNAGNPLATRLCNVSEYGEIWLQNATTGNCTENLETLEMQIDNITTESKNISAEAQFLTADANRLTAENITSAARVVGQIFNETRGAEEQAKRIAITTVSQILDAREDVFQKAAVIAEDSFSTLIEQMESYSFSLGDETVVEPNIAIQSVTRDKDTGSSVLFSVQKGSSGSLISGGTSINKTADRLNPDGQTELQILLNTGEIHQEDINMYLLLLDSILLDFFPTQLSIQYVTYSQYDKREFQLHSYACVYWNFVRNDWDTHGCLKDGSSAGFLGCRCNHTTNFAVLMTFKKDYQYPESLDILSNIGCALSIAGLALTIIFQIVTSCWLAIPKSGNFVKSPFLWSFIIPVTIILITNIAIFITITVKVLWKNNQNLTSTKKVSSLKKVFSTLSIAVVFGVTWILAYAMLINNDDIRIVFSYIFCLFNTTQGLQIFILYTVRTKVFQSEASKVLKSLSSSFDRAKKPSMSSVTPLRLRVRMYNMLRAIPSLHERFRLLEPSVVTEETSFS